VIGTLMLAAAATAANPADLAAIGASVSGLLVAYSPIAASARTDFPCCVFIKFPYELVERTRYPLSFQPVIKLVDPVVARFALFAHAEAMSAGSEEV